MSRSGYFDDLEDSKLALWRGAVKSAIRGARGQKLLRDLADAMDAMPEKVLIAYELIDAEGDACALGVVGRLRGIDMAKLDPDCPNDVALAFDVEPTLARKIVFENDEGNWDSETPAQRWKRMRKWVDKNLVKGG